MSAATIAPEVRRRNIVLGLALLALYIALVALFFIIFTARGLPKDPNEVRRQQAHEQAIRAAGTGAQAGP
jgi:hypothetical protein